MGILKKKKKEYKELEENDGYYHLTEILKRDAVYNVIYGERSAGKTYAALKKSLKDYFENGSEFAYLRRYEEDFKGKRGAAVFAPLVSNGEIELLSGGEWNGIEYYSGRFYLSKYNAENKSSLRDSKPCGWAFAISSMEHDKSTSYPMIRNIVFDEFLTRTIYLPNEFVLFQNVLSTIIRDRDDVKIFMLGNSVNQYCPYFSEMGLKNVKKMKPGDIDVYTYNDPKLTVAVEFTGGERIRNEKPSDHYFAFDNPKLKMITQGAWEFGLYPHLYPDYKYRPKDIRLTYYVKFDGETVRCDIVKINKNIVTYIHRQTRDIQDEEKHYIYSTEQSININRKVRIDKPENEIQQFIWEQFKYKNVYYENNEIGDLIMNYLNWCLTQK